MKKIFAVIVVMCLFIIAGCGGSADKEKVTLEPLKFTERVSGEQSFGVLVTNHNSESIDVKVKTDFYDRRENWLGHKFSRFPAIGAKQTIFLPVSANDDNAYKIKCSLESLDSSNYKVLKAGEDPTCDVRFSFLRDEVTITNNTEYKIENCGMQFYCYDVRGRIVNVMTYELGERIPAGKKIRRDCHIYDKLYKYASYDVVGFAYTND